MGVMVGIIIPGLGEIGGGMGGGVGGSMSLTGPAGGMTSLLGSGKLGVGAGEVVPIAVVVGGTCKSTLTGMALRETTGFSNAGSYGAAASAFSTAFLALSTFAAGLLGSCSCPGTGNTPPTSGGTSSGDGGGWYC